VAVIIFHIGMPKAGSTSLQLWLAERREMLRARNISCMRIAQYYDDDPITLEPITPADVTSKFVANEDEYRSDAVRRLCDALDAYAPRDEVVVLSSESYEVLFSMTGRREVLPHFDALARAHEVRIAYYVRPQHTWLESAWLQWGFRRSEVTPAAWVLSNRKRLNYFRTLQAARETAPNLAFEVRPFRADLLDGGSIVTDFARHFLGVHDVPPATDGELHANRSIPLEVALLLRAAPPGTFWSDLSDNTQLYALKDLVLGWDLPVSPALERARLVLQRHARRAYEFGNRKLIAEMGWETEFFVPPVDPAVAGDDSGDDLELDELDALWQSTASPVERRIAVRALRTLLDGRSGTGAGTVTPAAAPTPAQVPQHADETRRGGRPAPRVVRALRRRAQDLARAGRERARGARLTLAPPKSVEESSVARLRFTNRRASGPFEAFAAVRAPGERAPQVHRVPWRHSKPSLDVGRGETALLQVAIARATAAGATFELFALGPNGRPSRVPLPADAAVAVVVRRRDGGRVVAEHFGVLDLRSRAGETALVLRAIGADRSLRGAARTS
jgi:hypothetical protein